MSMKDLLDWRTKDVVNIFDEITLWSAPFGKILLENIPMKKNAHVVDIGFGTGFPLIELSQIFGESAKIFGIDIWEEGINRAKHKIKTLGLTNIEILERSATNIEIEANSIDLVTSNLGINNFEDRITVYSEIYRILNKDGSLCITTNPIGTFQELFDIIINTCKTMGLTNEHEAFENYINNRNTEKQIINEFSKSGFTSAKTLHSTTQMRFADARAIFNHSLIRIGFREYWEQMMPNTSSKVLEQVIQNIESEIARNGVFNMTIPILYLEFKKARS